jgi:hypothetical protein
MKIRGNRSWGIVSYGLLGLLLFVLTSGLNLLSAQPTWSHGGERHGSNSESVETPQDSGHNPGEMDNSGVSHSTEVDNQTDHGAQESPTPEPSPTLDSSIPTTQTQSAPAQSAPAQSAPVESTTRWYSNQIGLGESLVFGMIATPLLLHLLKWRFAK